jgi:hypothetical protein
MLGLERFWVDWSMAVAMTASALGCAQQRPRVQPLAEGPSSEPSRAALRGGPSEPHARADATPQEDAESSFSGRCSLAEELGNELGPARESAPGVWAARVRERLLPASRVAPLVERAAWRAIDALASARFDDLASLVGGEGLCLRAAKGAACVQLDATQLRRCANDPEKRTFPIDSGEDGPHRLTCSEAMKGVFSRRDLRRPTTITYNCFPPAGRGNNSAPVVQRPASAFVEFHAAQTEREPWLSLWLVFDVSAETPGSDRCSGDAVCDDRLRRLYLVELQAEYWGI